MLQEGETWDEQISVAKTEQSESKREKLPPSWGWLQLSPTSARSRKKLLPSVCITGRRQREEAGGGGVTIGIPNPNRAECRSTAHPHALAPTWPRATLTLRY